MSARTKSMATLKELEADTGIDITTLYRMCAPYGDLPCVRLSPGGTEKRRTSGAIRVRWDDWDAWVERHRVGGATKVARAVSSVIDLPGATRYSTRKAKAS